MYRYVIVHVCMYVHVCVCTHPGTGTGVYKIISMCQFDVSSVNQDLFFFLGPSHFLVVGRCWS